GLEVGLEAGRDGDRRWSPVWTLPAGEDTGDSFPGMPHERALRGAIVQPGRVLMIVLGNGMTRDVYRRGPGDGFAHAAALALERREGFVGLRAVDRTPAAIAPLCDRS
ncbi:MAG: hypothetical protein KC468_33695, partial [Myxococcales bacterium]|nr:hypothetical protein [Myxococcales bacterium]